MSPKVPTFKADDHVRVMQTTEMIQKGFAAQRGTIVSGWWEDRQMHQVKLPSGTFAIPASSLMKMGKPPVKKDPPAEV